MGNLRHTCHLLARSVIPGGTDFSLLCKNCKKCILNYNFFKEEKKCGDFVIVSEKFNNKNWDIKKKSLFQRKILGSSVRSDFIIKIDLYRITYARHCRYINIPTLLLTGRMSERVRFSICYAVHWKATQITKTHHREKLTL